MPMRRPAIAGATRPDTLTPSQSERGIHHRPQAGENLVADDGRGENVAARPCVRFAERERDRNIVARMPAEATGLDRIVVEIENAHERAVGEHGILGADLAAAADDGRLWLAALGEHRPHDTGRDRVVERAEAAAERIEQQELGLRDRSFRNVGAGQAERPFGETFDGATADLGEREHERATFSFLP